MPAPCALAPGWAATATATPTSLQRSASASAVLLLCCRCAAAVLLLKALCQSRVRCVCGFGRWTATGITLTSHFTIICISACADDARRGVPVALDGGRPVPEGGGCAALRAVHEPLLRRGGLRHSFDGVGGLRWVGVLHRRRRQAPSIRFIQCMFRFTLLVAGAEHGPRDRRQEPQGWGRPPQRARAAARGCATWLLPLLLHGGGGTGKRYLGACLASWSRNAVFRHIAASAFSPASVPQRGAAA